MEPIQTINVLIENLQDAINRQRAQTWSFQLVSLLNILQTYQWTDRKEFISFNAKQYTRFQFPTDEQDFDCYLIWRDANQMSDIHDHADEGCIFLVLQGTITEKRWQKNDQWFVLEFERTLQWWQAAYIANDIGYHALGSNHGEQCVSLHIYTPKWHKTTYFK
jgi:hypothetical protein